MTNKPNYESPFSFTRGSIVKAVYREPEIPAYVGNPLEEALPPILTTDQLILKLQHFPDYDESFRDKSDELRRLLIPESTRFFMPFDRHLDLYRRLEIVIRGGYAGRNPLARLVRRHVISKTESFDQYADQPDPAPDEFLSTAEGFTIAGISGVGKSYSINRGLKSFPQVIHHSEFRGQPFTHSQIVWLKIDCPFDGNPRGLCISFLKAIDALLGTTYRQQYAKRRQVQTELLADTMTVAANHYIGVLVIDEIQRLSVARSGGAEILLNFFIQLVNEIGIPVVLVGTFKALEVLSRQFSQMRRGTGQGDLIWDRMQKGEEWDVFVETLFRAQYTHKKFAPNDPASKSSQNHKGSSGKPPTLSDVLYDESQGITDLAIKLYRFAQERAIDSGKEIVNESIVRSVARDKFATLKPVLTAIREGNEKALNQWDDVYPALVRKYLQTSSGGVPQVAIKGELASDPQIRAELNNGNDGAAEHAPPESPKTPDSQGAATPAQSQASAKKQANATDQGVLPSIIAPLDKKKDLAAYEALKEAGYVSSPNTLV